MLFYRKGMQPDRVGTSNFMRLTRTTIIATLLFCANMCVAQPFGNEVVMALTYTKDVSVPLNGLQLFDHAQEAYKWTFGKEPGMRIIRSDREEGVIEAIARINFRSKFLSMREESMGVIKYRILIKVRAGGCNVTVSELVHVGNHTTRKGGVDLGLLTNSDVPNESIRNMSRPNLKRLYADLKEQSSYTINNVMQAFCSKLRASVEN